MPPTEKGTKKETISKATGKKVGPTTTDGNQRKEWIKKSTKS